MIFDRRKFLNAAGAAISVAAVGNVAAAGNSRSPVVKAIAFDAFPIFDPRAIGDLAEALVPGKGAVLNDLWRTRLFEYQWLRALSNHYADFQQTLIESLDFAARTLKIELSTETRTQLVAAYSSLKGWPDTERALRALKELGFKLVFLSNMTSSMLQANLRSAGLTAYFDRVLSSDSVRAYKPDPRAYAVACDQLGLGREQILFVPFAGWDVTGAKWFGFPTFWINRLGAAEEFAIHPDGQGRSLDDLVEFARKRASPA